MSATERYMDMEIKLARVRQFLGETKFDAVFCQRQDNFAWLTSGGHNGIPYNSERGECGLLVTQDQFYLVTNTIEKPRIVDEEVASLPIEVVEYPWYEDISVAIRKLVDPGHVITDVPMEGQMHYAGEKLSRLRFSLTEVEMERYRYLGETAAAVMEQYCMHIKPGQTELEIAAGLNERYLAQGFLPTVTLVACDERLDRYRHPVPTHHRFEKKCMVVSCVAYKGLIVALTRLIHVGQPSQEMSEKFKRTVQIDAELMAASRVGVHTKDMFEFIKKQYAAVGYDGEWKLHHQGGAIGYQNRDYILTPSVDFHIVENQAFAWNPSIQGTKSEDTIIVRKDKTEILTVSRSGWPQLTVQTQNGTMLKRPDIFVL
ncbi:Xaa-Pro aminopeptidase [Caldalkalibacillus uzonensis]|uniref:Xaa-Pro aminopeptidase n=1 Tax=Caldalkalibacillus uzonensis TaxID=353224 RepID=A0ABU0CRX5_9BACI|nr:M24 family metallopeptidase [Caldalkalibacillus uzonensis]MDQ0338614.1 Xaa-Pro aminopeptidase [Caldalkalibacillus uzonensis]